MLHRIKVWWLATCCIALLTVACSSIWTNSERYPADRQFFSREMRIIRHALGYVEVPINPQRIITLDGTGLENTLVLGVRPLGTTLNTAIDQLPVHLNGKLSGVEHVGMIRQPSLEKILTLNPDLILSMTGVSDGIYSQLTQIAPTVLASFGGGDRWKESFAVHANALDKSDLAEQWMRHYQERLSTFRQQMGDRLGTLEVSVVRLYPDAPSLYLPDSFVGKILQEAGLSRPLSQRNSGVQQRISRELLEYADGDVLFLWTSDDDFSAAEVQDTALRELKDDPLWSRLRAVENDKVYEVPGYWLGYGPIAADAVVDDLFTYLLEEL